MQNHNGRMVMLGINSIWKHCQYPYLICTQMLACIHINVGVYTPLYFISDVQSNLCILYIAVYFVTVVNPPKPICTYSMCIYWATLISRRMKICSSYYKISGCYHSYHALLRWFGKPTIDRSQNQLEKSWGYTRYSF